MFVFKLSWLPYILIIAGIWLAVEGQPAALILTAGGGAWLYFNYKSKQTSAPSNPPSGAPTATPTATAGTAASTPDPSIPVSPIAVPVTEYPSPEEKPSAPKASTMQFCGQCGAKIIPGSAFCGQCGAKLN